MEVLLHGLSRPKFSSPARKNKAWFWLARGLQRTSARPLLCVCLYTQSLCTCECAFASLWNSNDFSQSQSLPHSPGQVSIKPGKLFTPLKWLRRPRIALVEFLLTVELIVKSRFPVGALCNENSYLITMYQTDVHTQRILCFFFTEFSMKEI